MPATVWDDAHARSALAERPGSPLRASVRSTRASGTDARESVEVIAAGERPDAVVVSVGGGGLFCGVLHGMQRPAGTMCQWSRSRPRAPLRRTRALTAGRPVIDRAAITSIATTLGAREVAAEAVRGQAGTGDALAVSDRAAVTACLRFADDHRVVVEPACGAGAVGRLRSHAAGARLAGHVLVIVCGGAGVTLALLRAWAERTDA